MSAWLHIFANISTAVTEIKKGNRIIGSHGITYMLYRVVRGSNWIRTNNAEARFYRPLNNHPFTTPYCGRYRNRTLSFLTAPVFKTGCSPMNATFHSAEDNGFEPLSLFGELRFSKPVHYQTLSILHVLRLRFELKLNGA